jgi:hypothetical protein
VNARDKTCRSHLTELNTREAELTDITLWTTGHLATVVKTNRRCVLWESLESLSSLIVACVSSLLKFSTLSSVLSNESLTLYLTGYH